MSENIVELESLKCQIEQLSKDHHITLLKILKKNIENLNENKNGVFINLTELPPIVIDELKNYCLYIKTQNIKLDTMESNQKEIKSNFFSGAS